MNRGQLIIIAIVTSLAGLIFWAFVLQSDLNIQKNVGGILLAIVLLLLIVSDIAYSIRRKNK